MDGYIQSRKERRDKLVDIMRRVGLGVLVAIVLLPPHVLGILALGGAVVYICILGVQRLGGIRGWKPGSLAWG
jgi:hypothetical protein